MKNDLFYFKENNKRLINVSTLNSSLGFRLEDERLAHIRNKIESVDSIPLSQLSNIRLGGYTGADNSFLLEDEKLIEKLLSDYKYKDFLIEVKKNKDLVSSSNKKYIIYLEEGFTVENKPIDEYNAEEWFKKEYPYFYEYMVSNSTLSNRGNGIKGRQKHFMGDYWWELNGGQCNKDNYMNCSIDSSFVVSTVSKVFDVESYDGSYLPMSSIIFIGDCDFKNVDLFLKSKIVNSYYDRFISGVCLAGGYYLKNATLLSKLRVPKDLINIDRLSEDEFNLKISSIYGLSDEDIAYLTNY